MAPPAAADSWYTPTRVKKLLWHYGDLEALETGGGIHQEMTYGARQDDTATNRVEAEASVGGRNIQRKRPDPNGGFEERTCLKADLDFALAKLHPGIRRIVWRYYVESYSESDIARAFGCTRWMVRGARKQGVRELAEALGWVPSDDYRDEVSNEELASKMRDWIARTLGYCPAKGGAFLPCIVCDSHYDQHGNHVGPLQGRLMSDY